MIKKRPYELVPYHSLDEDGFIIRIGDNKLGTLSLDHKNIGLVIVNELNDLFEELYNEKGRTTPIMLTTHISDEDFERIEEIFIKHFGKCGDME